MNNLRDNLTVWFRHNVDFALLLAVFTETPRWAVAFMAINEPLWVGVPLGVLLAFATSHAWRRYFETRHNGLLVFNCASILIAVAVIAPVLFAMTDAQAHDVDITEVLPVQGIWIWATLLALTTFMPLVQLAAVRGMDEQSKPKPYRRTTVQVTRTDEQSEPDITIVQPAQIEQQQTIDLTALSKEEKRQYVFDLVRGGGHFVKSKVAGSLSISRTTLDNWIAEVQS